MPTLQEKRDSLAVYARQLEGLMTQSGAPLDAEQQAQWDVWIGKAKDLRTEIAADEAKQARDSDYQILSSYLESPQYRVPHGTEGQDARKSYEAAGWEFKGGMVYRQTSIGKSIEMFSEDVLLGDMPRDPSMAEFYTKTLRAIQSDYSKAFERLIRTTAQVPAGMAISMLKAEEQKALSEGLDTAGGFLVPPDLQAEVLARTAQMSVMRRLARTQTTSRDILVWPIVQAASATAGGVASGGGSIFSSGFVGSWVGETPSAADTDPAFGQFQIPIRKLRVSTRLSNDFVADSAVNVLAFMAQNGAENMALVEDFGFIQGDGSPLQPRGILNGIGITTIDVEGSTADTISNTTSATGTAPKIINLEYAVPAQYVNGASWVVRRSIEAKIRQLVDAQGRFMWINSGQSGSINQYQGRPGDLDGFPIYNSDFMPTDGTNANKVLLFGNIGQSYIIAQRAQITTTVLRERYADTDQVGIILWERVGGDVWNPDAVRIGVV